MKFHQVVEDIRANPSHGRVEFRAVGESKEMIYHSTARVGPYMAAGQELGQTANTCFTWVYLSNSKAKLNIQ